MQECLRFKWWCNTRRTCRMFFHLHKFFESNLRDELFAKRVSALFCGNILNQVIWASTEITFIFELTKGEDSLIDTATVLMLLLRTILKRSACRPAPPPLGSYPKTIIILSCPRIVQFSIEARDTRENVSIPRRRIRKLSEFQRGELLSGLRRQMFPSGRVSSAGRYLDRLSFHCLE